MLLSAERTGEGWIGDWMDYLALWEVQLCGTSGVGQAWGMGWGWGGLSLPSCPLEGSCFKTHADGFQTSRHQGSFLEPLSVVLMVTVRTGVNLLSHSSLSSSQLSVPEAGPCLLPASEA